MSIDTLLYISAAAQFLSALWGAIVSLPHTDWPQRHRLLVITVFAVLGLIGMAAATKQGRMAATESAVASTKLSESLSNVAQTSAEISRVQDLNTKLQERLLDQGKEITRLATRVVGEMTGGDSWAYVSFVAERGGGIPTVVHKGRSQISNLNVRIVDVRPNQPTVSTKSLREFVRRDVIFDVPSLGVSSVFIQPSLIVQFSDPNEQDFNIFFRTSFSSWTQNLRIRMISGKQERANRVYRGDDPKRKILVQCFTDGFPVRELEDAKAWNQKIGCADNN